ncbi:MAG TPA: VOC family protein [Steroidobacteraceae bacterium]|jgi:catechol 2,3-dioxygenase-like lactoylglutathione lyase family enzyme|nr:VOC family protein [Steroidobacteraceae bacterium]
MLGRFLELSLPAPDVQASLEFYTKLGFSQAQVGEAWPHAYAVVTDGRITIGLHAEADWPLALTFVRPDLLEALETLDELGVRLEVRRLSGNVFNEIGWRDPSGHLVRLVEARTFSPVERSALDLPRCGYFAEIALPCEDREISKAYWEFLGFVGLEEDDPLPHVSCTSDHVDLGLYAPEALKRGSLRYEVDDLRAALAKLAEAGIAARDPPPAFDRSRNALLTAPEGTPLLLTATAPP